MDIEDKINDVESKLNERSLAYEIMLELKKTIKNQWIAIWLLIGLLAASNIYWGWNFFQYDFVSYEQTTDGGGNASFIGGDGDISNGEANSKGQDKKEP